MRNEKQEFFNVKLDIFIQEKEARFQDQTKLYSNFGFSKNKKNTKLSDEALKRIHLKGHSAFVEVKIQLTRWKKISKTNPQASKKLYNRKSERILIEISTTSFPQQQVL